MRRLLGALAGAAILVSAGAVSAKEIKIGLITPPPHVWTKAANRIAERLPEATGGDLTVAVFPAGQLGNEPDMFQQMGSGILDAGLMTAGITSLRAPSLNGWFAPFHFADVADAAEAADTDAAREMLAQLEPTGLVGLGYTFAGMRHVLMKEGRIESLADVEAKKIRIVPFAGMKAWWDATGAAPTPVQLPEVYQALQSGVLDGVDIDLDALVGLKFYQAATHLTLTNHMAFPAVFVVSARTWQGLSEDQRAAFSEVVDEALDWATRQQIEAEKSNLAAMEAEIQVYAAPGAEAIFSAANQAFWEQYGDDPVIAAFREESGAAQ